MSGDGIVLSWQAVKKDCIYSCSSGGRGNIYMNGEVVG